MAKNINFGSLEESLNKVPFALTLSDVGAADQPLIFMNTAFRTMTGCDDGQLGQNCRFLQADLENEAARTEVRDALSQRRRTQVILRNRRMDGSQFSNLLLLEPVGLYDGLPDMVLGSQFVLTQEEEAALAKPHRSQDTDALSKAKSVGLTLQLERRRIVSNSAVSLLRSWCVMHLLGKEPAA